MTDGIDKQRQIPSRVDEPVPFMLWEPVEFVVAITSLGFFMAINMLFVGMVTMVGILWISKELRKGAKRGAAQHGLWAIGLNMDSVLPARFPAPFINELVE